VAKIT